MSALWASASNVLYNFFAVCSQVAGF